MEYREFMEQIKKDLPERLSGTLEGATVDTTQVDRLQGCSYEGLSIVPDGSMIGLTMDLQPYFQMFSNGISYENIVEQIADRAAGAYADRPAVTAEDFGSYEAVKDKLMIQLIGRKGNEEMLKTIPHHPIEDMEIVYRFHVQDTEMGQHRGTRCLMLCCNWRTGLGPGDKFHAGALWNYSRAASAGCLCLGSIP